MAFSGYSISPKSSLERNKENCGFILTFIPLIGAIICVLINRWAVLYPYACDFPVLPAVVGAVVPTILSAGRGISRSEARCARSAATVRLR